MIDSYSPFFVLFVNLVDRFVLFSFRQVSPLPKS